MIDLDAVFRNPEESEAKVRGGENHQKSEPEILPLEWHLEWDERAASLEFEYGLPRKHAEVAALTYVLAKIRQESRQRSISSGASHCKAD